MIDLWWILIPGIAILSWWIGRLELSQPQAKRHRQALVQKYFLGINYLLNEQSDKAIDTFLELVRVDQETIETHLALASLFRRRGEVEHAIRIHQNVLARPGMHDDSRKRLALLELGRDYLSAGLFDRAENALKQLLDDPEYRIQSLRLLLDLYQRMKDWPEAIATAQQLEPTETTGALLAHYCCEQAEQSKQADDLVRTQQHLQQALQYDPHAARAHLMLGWLAFERKEFKQAIDAFRIVQEQQPRLLFKALPALDESFYRVKDVAGLICFLKQAVDKGGGVEVAVKLADILHEKESATAAKDYLQEYLRQTPSLRALSAYMKLLPGALEQDSPQKAIEALLAKHPLYACKHCGFEAKHFHWQCPSCHVWGRIFPIEH